MFVKLNQSSMNFGKSSLDERITTLWLIFQTTKVTREIGKNRLKVSKTESTSTPSVTIGDPLWFLMLSFVQNFDGGSASNGSHFV